MQGAIPAPTGRPLGGNNNLLARYGLYAGPVIAALVGLLVLPAVFHALGDHDIQISDRVSLFDSIWLVLGAALSVFLLSTRGAMLDQLSGAIRARLEDLQRRSAADGDRNDQAVPSRNGADLPAAGSTTVARLFDIVYLLVVQAIVREPFVGVVKTWVPEATIDGAYVVLVVLFALALLINVRAVSRPLLDFLLWLGLDTAVPTAGFVSSNATETFTRMTATSTSARTGSGQRSTTSGRSAPPSVAEPTIAAPDALQPTVLEGSVEATVAAPGSSEATVLAPTTNEATVVAPSTADDTVVASDAGETIVAGPNGTLEGNVSQQGRSKGDR